MIVFLTVAYILLLLTLIKTKVLPEKKWVWLTIIPYDLVLIVGFFIPMQWGSPSGDLRLMYHSVAISANVSGEVIEVPVKANVPLKKGDILFKLDPTLYQANYDAIKADTALVKLRLSQAISLAKAEAGTIYEVQSYEAQLSKLKAQLKSAKWNLDKTIVRAPSDGYVTFVGLRVGQRVTAVPFNKNMAFIDTSELIAGSQIAQNFTRYIEKGQEVEVTFKARPGKIYKAEVMYILPITAQGQFTFSGSAASQETSQAGPFFVRIKIKDPDIPKNLIVGSLGSVAIYTAHVKSAQVIQRVMIRITSIMNYIIP